MVAEVGEVAAAEDGMGAVGANGGGSIARFDFCHVVFLLAGFASFTELESTRTRRGNQRRLGKPACVVKPSKKTSTSMRGLRMRIIEGREKGASAGITVYSYLNCIIIM